MNAISPRKMCSLVIVITILVNVAWQLLPPMRTAVAAPGEGTTAQPRDPRGGSPQSGLEQISHQGVVSVNGQRFTGPGGFRFAIVDPDTGVIRWSSSPDGDGDGVPDASVPLDVRDGVYSVRLGSPPMTPVPAGIFGSANLHLRIWFHDGTVNGVQRLMPDQPLTSTPYAFSAVTSPPIGSIIAWHMNIGATPIARPDGWMICNGDPLPADSSLKTLYGATNTPNLNSADGYEGGQFLRGGSSSGQPQDATRIYAGPYVDCNYFLIPRYVSLGNEDKTEDYLIRDLTRVTSPAGTCSVTMQRASVRPVNMSVVWIIRVK